MTRPGPARPEALLEGLPAVAPRTVIRLNEAQLYLLEAPTDAAERAAAGLQTLLADSARGPVLVLATLWPEYWDALTREPGTRRTLLEGCRITVPGTFTAAQVAALRRSGDPRLAAAGTADSGQVTQFLAGAPVLLDRYRDAQPPTRAVIESAMDARRLGHGMALPHALLEAAAPAYMSDAEWDSAGDDWLERALAFTGAPCKGTAGPVTRIRPRPASGQAAASAPAAPGGRRTSWPTTSTSTAAATAPPGSRQMSSGLRIAGALAARLLSAPLPAAGACSGMPPSSARMPPATATPTPPPRS